MNLRRVILMAFCLVLPQCHLDDPVVGAPCTPSSEKSSAFFGFRVTEDTIETGAPECGAGVCLVNHFQGRVSCPLGQPSPDDGQGFSGCQEAGASATENQGKACCIPGTNNQVNEAVCGQCLGQGRDRTRDAANAVYCSCRCGVAEGEPPDEDFEFCTCPDGFECAELRKNLGLGDPDLTGKYCIRAGTAYDANQDQCGQVDGFWSSSCSGVGTGQCQASGGPCSD